MKGLDRVLMVMPLLAVPLPVVAVGPQVVRVLPGYACMMLNLTERQYMDPATHVPVRSEPQVNAPQVGLASGTIAVPTPVREQNGFMEALFPTGQTVWIESKMLRPYHSLSDPTAKCIPALMSNGRIGFTYSH